MKNEKKTALYQSPELELIAFETRDIISTSGYTDKVPDENEDTDWNEN